MSNKTRVLEFLYKSSSNQYNINQISRLLGISVGSSFKILKQFEKDGYVKSEKRNNALLYKINLVDKTKNAFNKIEEEKAEKAKKKTKVICSIGPSSEKTAIIRKLLEAGMDAARIDISSNDEKNVLQLIKNIREVSDEIPIILDFSNEKINSIRPWIKFALKNDADFIAISAANAEDIKKINRLLGYMDMRHVIGQKIKILVNIGKEALKNCQEVIDEAYGVILNRNSLVNGKRYEVLPMIQKMVINECDKQGKPVIAAGQILESMANEKTPGIMETYSVANLIREGASSIMLSEETETGKYPLASVETLSRIIKSVETAIEPYASNIKDDFAYSIGKAILEVEKSSSIDAILIITSGGYSARMMASRKLRCKIIAATSSKRILRQLNILWGINPLFITGNLEDISNEEKKEAIIKALQKGLIKKSDLIAIVASVFHSKSKTTNLLEMHKVEEFLNYLERFKVKTSINNEGWHNELL